MHYVCLGATTKCIQLAVIHTSHITSTPVSLCAVDSCNIRSFLVHMEHFPYIIVVTPNLQVRVRTFNMDTHYTGVHFQYTCAVHMHIYMYVVPLQRYTYATGLHKTLPQHNNCGCILYMYMYIYLTDIHTKEVEKNGYDKWLGKIHQFLQKDPEIAPCYQLQNITAHGLQFIYEGVDMNLLLSPHWTRPGDFFKSLSSVSSALQFR